MKSSLWVAATVIALSACGGGGDGNGSSATSAPAPAPAPAPEPAPAPAPAPTPAALTVSYQAIPASGAFASQLNAEGANGWRYISGLAFTQGGSVDIKELFAKSSDTTYGYELLTSATTAAAFQAQLDAQGARGFVYGGPDMRGEIYRKDNGSTATFSYRVIAAPATETTAELLAQDKAQGAEGYYHVSGSLMAGSATVRVYQKELGSSATYDVEMLPVPSTEADFLAQLNAQGARGYRFKSGYSFGSEGLRNIYDKDTSQSATFSYSALPSLGNAADFVTQANAQGANGVILVGDYVMPGGATKTLYITPAACSGLLCGPRNPFGL
jgi:hypothetical protein